MTFTCPWASSRIPPWALTTAGSTWPCSKGTTKPINITAVDLDGLNDQLEMAYIRLGGKEEWKKAPCFSLYIEPVSPLSHSKEVVQKLLFASDHDIPFVYTPCPMAGATSPATLAGLLVQALTESLFGIVLSQLRKPGAKLIIGGLHVQHGHADHHLWPTARPRWRCSAPVTPI